MERGSKHKPETLAKISEGMKNKKGVKKTDIEIIKHNLEILEEKLDCIFRLLSAGGKKYV
jgi:hypothetical protein